jgi:hypothetical protein
VNRPVSSLVLALVLVLPACGKKESPAPAAKAPAPAAPAVAAADAPAARLTVRGVVQETLDASDYTYMRLKTADGETWAAVLKSPVKKGDDVTVVNAAPMDGFESKTLNRKFDRIVFGNLAPSGEAGPVPMASGHAPADPAKVREEMKSQHAAAASGPADAGKIEVKKAEGAKGRSVAELFAQRAALKDKEVAVRGKVVKFTAQVMGKNWIHLRDGSGSREGKDDDITVTTTDAAAVGDVVLATGTVRLDRDFGAGYSYPVLIENGKLSK